MTTYIVSSGVTSTHLTLHTGDILEVLSGGKAVSITVDSGATEYVSSGGSAVSTTLNGGGGLQISTGARASFTTVNDASTEFVFSGGTAFSTTVNNSGTEQIYASGQASVTTVNGNGTVYVMSDGTAVSTMLAGSNAFEVVSSAGSAISTTIDSGAYAWVQAGGKASFLTVSNGGTEDVFSGATARFATVDSGGTANVSGTAISTTVNNGGFEEVSSGGTTSFTTVNSGGTEDVFSGATARFTAVTNGGSAFVYAGGTTSSATVNSGGTEYVYQSGTAISTTVKSGGTEVVFPGGTATGTVVSSGGTLVEPASSGSGGLTIDVSYDASVSSAPAGFETTVSAAVANLESLISTPISITIDVGYGEVSGTLLGGNLGQSESTGIDVSYQTLRSALLARTATSDEIAAAASLPSSDPTGGGTFYVTYAEAEALDLSSGPGAGAAVGAIGLSSSLPFTYGTTDAVTSGTYDAFGIVEHEITEVLGRTDDLGAGGEYTPLDLFRYSSPGARDLTPTAGWFSVNGSDLLALFNDPSNGGDAGDWSSSVPNDSFDAFSGQGTVNPLSPTDLRMMDVIGYTPTLSCFAGGTRIATARGEIAVEAIGVGERARVLLGGGFAEVIWVGRREVDCAGHAEPRQVWPVRVSAGAFGPGRPHSDLWLSPDHAVYVEEVLIPIKHLINGSTIVQVPMARVTYHHLELAEHDVLLAEGLPAESFLDMRDGWKYASRVGPVRLYPDYSARMWEAFGCARLVVTGPELVAARALMAGFAAAQKSA